jgi:corrinoid protein of di/trimethylamine methyltransferase
MANKEEILRKLEEAVKTGDDELSTETADEALAAGLNALECISDGLIKGMSIVSERYHNREMYLPQVLLAADAMYAALDKFSPHVKVDRASGTKAVVIGTVAGDVHDIGKNLVKIMLVSAGFEVHDLGNDVPVEAFVEKAREVDADFVCMSTLMTPTMESMKRTIDALKEEGLRAKVRVAVGGAPISQEFADSIGADIYALNAFDACEVLKAA